MVVPELKFKTDFQDGNHMAANIVSDKSNLANFDLQAALILSTLI